MSNTVLKQKIDGLPYRLALCGGWIDQPFVSIHNPSPPGSMTVVSVLPECRYMEMAGMATSTRKVARRLFGNKLPDKPCDELVKELYFAENKGKDSPSGSQDMVGMIYPGVVRMDFDIHHEGGIFPKKIHSNTNPKVARWLESVIKILPICQRPAGYSPLGIKRLDPTWVGRLSQSGKDCYKAICTQNVRALQQSMQLCMSAWKALLPHSLVHPLITIDLLAILEWYNKRYGGAMYSGCGGGYLFVATKEPVPGSFGCRIRIQS